MTAPSAETLQSYLSMAERLLADHGRILKKRGKRDVSAHTLMDDALRLGHIGRLLSIAQRLAENDPGKAVTPQMEAEALKERDEIATMSQKLAWCLLAVRSAFGLPEKPANTSVVGLVDETFEAVRALTIKGAGGAMSPEEAHELSDTELSIACRLNVFGQSVEAEASWRQAKMKAEVLKEPIPPHPVLKLDLRTGKPIDAARA